MHERTPEPPAAANSARDRLGLKTASARRPSQIFRKVPTEPRRKPKTTDVALIVCFLTAVSLPLVGLALSLDSGFVIEENRTLASRPELKLNKKDLASYPARLESYFNDRFGFRARLIQWLNLLKVAALGVSPTSKVIIGRDGWLFYGDLDIPYFRAVEPLTLGQLRNWQKRLEQRQSWLAARGIPYLIVFTPLKSTIYPEFMPHTYNRVGAVSRLDQLLAHLKANSKLAIVDLRPPILDEKSRHQVFYRTDTHWTNRGAYVGYTQIVKALSAWFPQLEPLPRSAFEELQISEPGRDLALLLGMQPYYWDRYVDLKMVKPPLAHPVEPAPPPGATPYPGP